MKNTLIKAVSIFLALTCALALFGAVRGISEISECKTYWEKTKEEALDSFSQLEDGISQLSENKSTYVEGVDTYETSLATYEEGMKTIENGEAQLEEGKKSLEEGKIAIEENSDKLAAGHAQYNASYEQYLAGKAKIEAGEAELAKNTQAYEEGKAQLAEVEPIYNLVMPLYWQHQKAEEQLAIAQESGNAVSIAFWTAEVERTQNVVNSELKGYTIEYIVTNYEAGKAKIAEYEAAQAQIEEGKAQIADAEAKLKTAKQTLDSGDEALAAGKKTLAEGEVTIAENEEKLKAGKEQLADGEEQLADGAAKLAQFEDGLVAAADGCELALSTDTYYDKKDKPIVESIEDRLGENFTIYEMEGGSYVEHNGVKMLNLNNCSKIVTAGRDFVSDTENAVTKELTGRAVGLIITAVAAIIGIACALIEICGGRKVGIAGIACAVLSLIAAIAVALSYDKAYPLTKIAGGSGDGMVMFVIVAIAVMAMVIGVLTIEKKAPVEEDEE